MVLLLILRIHEIDLHNPIRFNTEKRLPAHLYQKSPFFQRFGIIGPRQAATVFYQYIQTQR